MEETLGSLQKHENFLKEIFGLQISKVTESEVHIDVKFCGYSLVVTKQRGRFFISEVSRRRLIFSLPTRKGESVLQTFD